MSVEYRLTIKSLPEELRPRERLFRKGAATLSDSELLAILIRSGTFSASALDLAAYLITRFGGLRGLLDVSLEELCKVNGIGLAKATQIKAALEVGRRVAAAPAAARPVIRSPEEVAALVMEEMRYLDREHFNVLILNTKNQVLAIENISIGTLNSSSVHPRELFKAAVKKSAASLILVHNHPSGDPTPSQQDLDLTKRLMEAGEVIGINILDHIIIGDNKYTSLRAEGLV